MLVSMKRPNFEKSEALQAEVIEALDIIERMMEKDDAGDAIEMQLDKIEKINTELKALRPAVDEENQRLNTWAYCQILTPIIIAAISITLFSLSN